MKFHIWVLYKKLYRKRSFVKAIIDLGLWISNCTFRISVQICVKSDVEDTQHRSVVKMCVVKTHTLTKRVTEILPVFSLWLPFRQHLIHKNSLTACLCGSPFIESHLKADVAELDATVLPPAYPVTVLRDATSCSLVELCRRFGYVEETSFFETCILISYTTRRHIPKNSYPNTWLPSESHIVSVRQPSDMPCSSCAVSVWFQCIGV